MQAEINNIHVGDRVSLIDPYDGKTSEPFTLAEPIDSMQSTVFIWRVDDMPLILGRSHAVQCRVVFHSTVPRDATPAPRDAYDA